jgi:exportin-7
MDLASLLQFGRAYYSLLEVLCHNHTNVIVNLDTATFAHIVQSLEAGLKCLDVSISSQVGFPSFQTSDAFAVCTFSGAFKEACPAGAGAGVDYKL